MIEDVTYIEADNLQKRIGSYIKANNHSVFYLYAKNCINWALIELATWNYGFINVPLYDTLGEEALNHIVDITEGTLMFASKASLPMILKMVKNNKHSLQ